MKGDKGVEIGKERPEFSLFFDSWKKNGRLFAALNRISSNSSNTSRILYEGLNLLSGKGIIEELSIDLSAILEPNNISIFEVQRLGITDLEEARAELAAKRTMQPQPEPPATRLGVRLLFLFCLHSMKCLSYLMQKMC